LPAHAPAAGVAKPASVDVRGLAFLFSSALSCFPLPPAWISFFFLKDLPVPVPVGQPDFPRGGEFLAIFRWDLELSRGVGLIHPLPLTLICSRTLRPVRPASFISTFPHSNILGRGLWCYCWLRGLARWLAAIPPSNLPQVDPLLAHSLMRAPLTLPPVLVGSREQPPAVYLTPCKRFIAFLLRTLIPFSRLRPHPKGLSSCLDEMPFLCWVNPILKEFGRVRYCIVSSPLISQHVRGI